jgi:hypothetical protein
MRASVKRASIRRVAFAAVAFAIAVVAVTFVSSITFNPLVATAVSLLAYTIPDRVLDLIFGKKDEPKLKLRPIGIDSQTPFNPIQFINIVWSFAEGLTGPATILEYPKTPEAEAGKQGAGKIQQTELHARLGIIRFSNTGSDAINCRVEVRCEVDVLGSNKKVWADCGYLGWFSKAKRSSLVQMKKVDVFQMNKVLANADEEIYQKQEKDLQVCYTVKGGNALILCSDDRLHAFPYDETKPAKVKLELTITAQKYPVTKKLFEVTGNSESITIRELPS